MWISWMGQDSRATASGLVRFFCARRAFNFASTANASATYSTSAFPRAHPQFGSRFTARRSLMKRQPTTWGSSPWQHVDKPLGWRGVDPVWPTWFRWVMKPSTA